MIKYFEKKANENSQFIIIEIDGFLLKTITGINGIKKTGRSSHCGSNYIALKEANELILEYRRRQYQEVGYINGYHDDILDNAQWHLGGDFPQYLNEHQAFVHTGFFIGWLIDNNFINIEFNIYMYDGIKKYISKEVTAPMFYRLYMDGKFTFDTLSDVIKPFVLRYYNTDFSKSKYIFDLVGCLGEDLPSVYDIEDTLENYEKIKAVIDYNYRLGVFE